MAAGAAAGGAGGAAGGMGGMMGPVMGMMGGGEKKEQPIAMQTAPQAPFVDIGSTPISTDPAKRYMSQISNFGQQR